MRVPVPRNRLVAFTLAGALLTAVVAGALALPGGGLADAGEQPNSPGTTSSDEAQRVADAPTPNQEFTPAVGSQSGYEDEEHEESEEDDDDGHGDGYEEEHEDDEDEEDE